MHGSQCSRRTGWQTWPGFTLAHLSDGTTRYYPEGNGIAAIVADLPIGGISVENFLRESVRGMLAQYSYPPRPECAKLYQSATGYAVPVELGAWSWSSTFGRWGRIVTFADGWHGYTYPRVDSRDFTPGGLAAAWIAEHTGGLMAAGVPVEMAYAEAESYFAREDVRKY